MSSQPPQAFMQQLIESGARLFVDPALIYGRFFSACVTFWATGSSVPTATAPSSFARTDRIFQLLWLAYEQWVTRGWLQYSRVALDLQDTYNHLRWSAVMNDEDKLTATIAEAAYVYLEGVARLAENSGTLFKEDLRVVLAELRRLHGDPAAPGTV